VLIASPTYRVDEEGLYIDIAPASHANVDTNEEKDEDYDSGSNSESDSMFDSDLDDEVDDRLPCGPKKNMVSSCIVHC
jgi:hypothetical protein